MAVVAAAVAAALRRGVRVAAAGAAAAELLCDELMAAIRSPLRIAPVPLMPIVAASAFNSGNTIAVRPVPAARRLVRAPPLSASPSGDAASLGASVVSVTRILPKKAHSIVR